jgi:hypothetical protein
MPQLDVLIMGSQTFFLVPFFIGYFVFLKYILPILSFEIKRNRVLYNNIMRWFDKNIHYLFNSTKNDKYSIEGLYKLSYIVDIFISYNTKKNILFGLLYNYDLLLLRSKYRLRRENRTF